MKGHWPFEITRNSSVRGDCLNLQYWSNQLLIASKIWPDDHDDSDWFARKWMTQGNTRAKSHDRDFAFGISNNRSTALYHGSPKAIHFLSWKNERNRCFWGLPSHLNYMEILETRGFILKGFELGTTLS